MLFNTIDFAIFFPIIFILYWKVFNRNLNVQNLFILIASYTFYAWWDWRFLFLIIFSSILDYCVGLLFLNNKNQRKRRILLYFSLAGNLGMLFFFKYFNFFINNFVETFRFFGYKFDESSLNIILPVGISFYTFQTLSYTIDIYNKKISPTKNIINFFAFVSFFPQLVAGPIERAHNLLPQFQKTRVFDYNISIKGSQQIIWGLFKKIVIADNLSSVVDGCFSNPELYSSVTLIIGVIFFAFQIYCDFSGYSDIAIGTARLFGFELIIIGIISGLAGCAVDSVIGATVQGIFQCEGACKKITEKNKHCGAPAKHLRGWRYLENNMVNFLASLSGGFVAIILGYIFLILR